MKLAIFIVSILSTCYCVKGQSLDIKWYSETDNNGVIIQNSFPKGGPYTGPVERYFNHSYLVFFTRIKNETGSPIKLAVDFSADSIPIPNSPNTFMQLFLPADTMTLDKQAEFSYGVTELGHFDRSSSFQQKLDADEDCLFYVVAIFYQTRRGAWNHERGGNRAELVLKGQDLFYQMTPQVDYLPCGHLNFDNLKDW